MKKFLSVFLLVVFMYGNDFYENQDNNENIFQSLKEKYSTYMEGQNLLFVDIYAEAGVLTCTQQAIDVQFGVFENIYGVIGYGAYSEDEFEAEDNNERRASGNFLNLGFSYHFEPFDISKDYDSMITISYIQRNMLNTSYAPATDTYDTAKNNKDASLLMCNWTIYKKYKHTGLTFGMGFGDGDMFLKAGVRFRFF